MPPRSQKRIREAVKMFFFSGPAPKALAPFFSLKIAGNEIWQKIFHKIFGLKAPYFCQIFQQLVKNNDFANSVHMMLICSLNKKPLNKECFVYDQEQNKKKFPGH